MQIKSKECSPAAKAWWALGGLVGVVLAALFIRELPSLRRELRLLRM